MTKVQISIHPQIRSGEQAVFEGDKIMRSSPESVLAACRYLQKLGYLYEDSYHDRIDNFRDVKSGTISYQLFWYPLI